MILSAIPAASAALPIPAAATLLQVDTLVTVASRDTYDLVYALAAGTFLVLLLVLIVTLIGALREVHRGVRGAQRALVEARDAVFRDEAVERLRETAGHVEAMAAALRSETDAASRSLRKVSDQVELAAHRMEERIEEFNALLSVVQGEAEEVFLDTAATARGVRSGLGELAGGSRRRPPPRSRPVPSGSGTPRSDTPGMVGVTPDSEVELHAPSGDPLPGGLSEGPARPPAASPLPTASGHDGDPTPHLPASPGSRTSPPPPSDPS